MTFGVAILIVVAAWCSVSIAASLLFGGMAGPRDTAAPPRQSMPEDETELRKAG